MSTHPNAILLLTITPDDLSRKTYRAILEKYGNKDDGIKIEEEEFNTAVMESDYLDGYQISAKEGDIVAFNLVTYGYGEVIAWKELEAMKCALEKWAVMVCEEFKCQYEIFITANYW